MCQLCWGDLIMMNNQTFEKWANRDTSLDHERPLIPHITKGSSEF